jgi:hypothetical protein
MKQVQRSLPEFLRSLFWDVDFAALDWEADRDLIIRRVLQAGSWSAVRWLRSACGDQALRAWLSVHTGGRLSPRQLRFWELVLNIPSQEVDHWIAETKNGPWGRRTWQ